MLEVFPTLPVIATTCGLKRQIVIWASFFKTHFKIFTKIDKGIIDAGGVNLKYIGVLATAFDAIDTKYARSKNITVCNLGGYSTEAVSEFFFAALLEQIRALEQSKQQARQEDYSFDKFMGLELKDKVLGVIGAGKIGKRIAEIGLAFGAKVSYFSRVNKPEIDKLGAQKKELDEILKTSDFIALTLALNEETKGIISKADVLRNFITVLFLKE